MHRVSVSEAKAGFSVLVERVESGEEIVVTRNGKPVATIRPLRPRSGGFFRNEIEVHDASWWHADAD
jgi:prevent-host-death family protein